MKRPAARRLSLPLLTCLSAAVAASAFGADAPSLVWPTDAGRCVTSTFCEFRPDHFHSGIDISTWGRTGYQCLAAGDGDLVRARVSCGGYGRALYLRLRDGRTVVYAHLSRFEGALADTLRAFQLREGTAYLDRTFPPGAFPVRAGDVVAHTGQSGVGVPHLHVEIRDEAERPLDPLRAGLPVADTTPPWIQRIALTPLTPLSSVDGRSDTVILDVHPGEAGGAGRIPRTIPVEGEVGLAVELDETTDVCRFRLAPARLELGEGDETLYSVDYARFSFAETGDMDQQIDPRFSYASVGRFHNLYRRPGNDLSFVDDRAGADGIVRALRERERRWTIGADETAPAARAIAQASSVQREGERTRTLVVTAADAAGNLGTATVSLSFAAPPSVRALSALLPGPAGTDDPDAPLALGLAWNDTLEVHGGIARGGRPLKHVELEWSPDGGATWIDAEPTLPGADDAFHALVPLGRRVPGTGRDGVVVRARAVDELGAAGIARTVAVEGALPPDGREVPDAPPAEVAAVGGWTEVRFPESVGWQAVSGGWERSRPGDAAADSLTAVFVRPYGRGVRIVLPARRGGAGPRAYRGLGSQWAGIDPWGRPVAVSFDVPAMFAPTDSGVVVAGEAGVVRIAPGSFREETSLALRTAPARLATDSELRAAGPLHFLECGAVPPADAWTLELRATEADVDRDHVGIFVQDGARFRYIGGERTDDGAWRATSRSLLGAGLFEDVTPPLIGASRLERRFGVLQLFFHAEDGGAGIDCDGVDVFLDGQPLVHELDDETGDVVATPAGAPARGSELKVEIRATDRCGNASRREETVRVP